MRKRAFLINSLMLTSAVLLSRVIGISFRVYMSNKIGAEGIGLYQLICTIFLFASTFVTSGVSLAVTRLVTEALARKEYQKAKTAVRRALVLGLFFSLLMGGALFFSADYIGNQVLKDPRTGRSQHNGAAGIFQAHGRQKVHYQGENNDFRDLLQQLLAGGFDHLANREEISPKASGHRHERQTGSQNLQR